MRYLVIGMPGCGNLGDDLISTLLQNQIKSFEPDAEIAILCGEFSEFKCLSGVKKLFVPRNIPLKHWKRKRIIIDYIKRCDRILIGGGGLFQDTHSFFTIHKYLHWLYYANCQVDCVGIGVGPIRYSFNERYLKQVLCRPGISIQVRDKESYNYLIYHQFDKVIIGCDVVEGSALSLKQIKHDGVVLGCSIRKWHDLDISRVCQIINSQVELLNATKVYLFVFENSIASSEEYDFAVEISKFIHRSHEIYTYGRDENIFEKLCEVDYAIASRYHANIIWQKIGVPVIPIPYAPKVYSLYLSSGIKLNPIDSMDFSTEYQRLPSFENFKISNPYTNIKVYFSLFEKFTNFVFECFCFIMSSLISIYHRI
mgnify:FL=1